MARGVPVQSGGVELSAWRRPGSGGIDKRQGVDTDYICAGSTVRGTCCG